MTDGDDEPELWVLDGDDVAELGDDDPDDDGHAAAGALRASRDLELASTLTSEDVAGDDWADTAWLDALAPRPGARAADEADQPDEQVASQVEADDVEDFVTPLPPIDEGWAVADVDADDAPDADRTARAVAAVDGAPRRAPTSADEFAGLVDPITFDDTGATVEPDDEPMPTTDEPRPSRQRRRPTKSGDEVSEFLRELSRLALDED